ncbi:hypothetical protein SRB5_01590 [Streptomyces sp. RB5]|uniref:Uncharacterized protein n=1 Tax=Streptomyces smaragdinus TaxID=2585196 RepID=A0A7K0C9B7_9ACTN|nr:hypothetical protein [Streptomyces smaragdinus]MQY10055.1 hypothetical protein [Streptomyces smaragdinus]
MTSQEIRLDCRQHAARDVLVVVPYIDGVPLTTMIDHFETGAGMEPAGDAYGGLIPAFFRYGPMEEHFHGRSTNSLGPKTPVLGCECGEVGCWPLMVDITVTPGHVTWHSFEQPYRRERDYSGFGPFRFERRQYDESVRVLAEAVSAEVA